MANRSAQSVAPKTLPVLPSDVFRVVSGANEGDGLSVSEDLVLDDVYALVEPRDPGSLSVVCTAGRYTVARGSELGAPGSHVHLDSTLTLMGDGTQVTEVLVLAEMDEYGLVAAVYLLPLAPLTARTNYRLVGFDTDEVEQKLAHLACVSFTKGTRISLSTGRQVAVEDLAIGDLVLTRDDGAQPLRWIGHSTQRAVGAFAPIRISAGTLNNLDDLVVSPDHRLFIYQRSDRLGAGRSELLVKAQHLVDGSSVTVDQGGFVDYYQLLFDRHQIIYAEGIAAESMLVDESTAPLVDRGLLRELANTPARLREINGMDVQRALLDRPDVVSLLRHASKG